MDNKDYIWDLTDVNIDLSLDKKQRIKELLKTIDKTKYNKKIKVNNTVVNLNFLGVDKLSPKSILKVLE